MSFNSAKDPDILRYFRKFILTAQKITKVEDSEISFVKEKEIWGRITEKRLYKINKKCDVIISMGLCFGGTVVKRAVVAKMMDRCCTAREKRV